MRLLGELTNLNDTRRIAAYLLTKGVETQVEQEGAIWEVWVKDEDQFKDSLSDFESFKAEPNSTKYQGVIEQATAIVRDKERKRREVQKNIVKVSESRPKQQNSPLTILLIVISGIVLLLTDFGENRNSPVKQALSFTSVGSPEGAKLWNEHQGNIDSLDLRLASIHRGEIWRLITPIFMHSGMMHIVFNMIMLFQLGQIVEGRYGTFWFAVIVLATASVSNFVQATVPYSFGGSPSILLENGYLTSMFLGMSGVVFGLFGFVWMKSTYDRNFGFRLSQGTVIFLLAYMFFCMTPLADRFDLHVANWAHGIGLVVGMIAGYFPSVLATR